MGADGSTCVESFQLGEQLVAVHELTLPNFLDSLGEFFLLLGRQPHRLVRIPRQDCDTLTVRESAGWHLDLAVYNRARNNLR